MSQSAEPTKPGAIPRETSEFDRGLSFFDAIYGFAVTLLITTVDLPESDAWKDLESLAESGLAEQLFGVVLSFIVICVLWRVNVGLMKNLNGLNAPTLIANLAACGLVILLPFTTEGIADPHSADYSLPTAFYAVNIAAISIAQMVMYQLGRVTGLERTPTSDRENWLQVAEASVIPIVFLVSIPIALSWGPIPGQLVWASLIVLVPVVSKLVRTLDPGAT